jgi:AAA family ATP:ADP antiporter
VVFSAASQRFGREQLFNGIVLSFISFFALFGWVLYPMHETLHWYSLGAKLTEVRSHLE